ncbi:MAG: RHS repeat-associated core domain-containing protein [Caldilineaceae bacterium]|nr:RHS repeat-associated core domain-containing protein [Caldilineaceae bacterium]
MRKGSTLYYLHADHLGSTALTTTGSGAGVSQTYCAYGKTRSGTTCASGNSLATDRQFTGQKVDVTGLHYYNARYYDDHIGQFVSPDTIVPDGINLFDWNRYMYVRGRPLNANDPSGHYSNEEIMQHFGCDSWSCVESNFNEGGALEGSWGWLNVLQDAQDGDMVTSTLLASLDGHSGSINSSLSGRIQRNAAGRIGVNLDTYVGTDYQRHLVEGMVDSDAFAQFARQGAVGLYSSEHGPVYAHSSQAACYTTNQCATQTLDAVSTVAAGVAVACVGTGAIPCALAASRVSTGASALGAVISAGNAAINEGTTSDAVVSVTTAAMGAVSPPYVAFPISVYQWYRDNKPH